jgi:hypothetical protein
MAGAPGQGGTTGGTACLTFKTPTQVGSFETTALNGPSGMVASRAHAGVLYAQLDMGGPVTVFAATPAGKALGEYTLAGVTETDWEDIAVGPGPGGGSFIYVADIGDNSMNRTQVQIVRIAEPDVSTTQALAKESLTGAQVLHFTYPEGAQDAETLIVDPTNGDLIIITKATTGNSVVYRAPGSTAADTPTVLEKVTTIAIGATGRSGQVSGGDASPNGDRFMVRTYTSVLVWARAATLAATFAATPHTLAWSTEPQGEGATFSADGKSLFLTGEQARLIYQADANCP